MKGAESTEHGYLLHLNRDTSPQRRSCTSTPLFATNPLDRYSPSQARSRGETGGRDRGPAHSSEWKRLTGMDMSEEGQDMAG
ncbi:hypothetical protein ACETU7_04290 [Rhodococcus sp. 3Y1]